MESFSPALRGTSYPGCLRLYQLLSMNRHAPIYGVEECYDERAATLSGLMGLLLVSPRVALRLSRKIVAAHRSWRFCFGRSLKPDDLHHVIKPGIADPRTLETCRPITLAMEVTAQLSDDDQGCSEGEFISSFFLANNWSTSHSQGSKRSAHGRSGNSRPSSVNNMIRQAITASIAMARSRALAL